MAKKIPFNGCVAFRGSRATLELDFDGGAAPPGVAVRPTQGGGGDGALVAVTRAPSAEQLLEDIRTNCVAHHESRAGATKRDIQAYIYSCQTKFRLPTGEAGGWNAEAQSKLDQWLQAPKRQAKNAKTDAHGGKGGKQDEADETKGCEKENNEESDSDTDESNSSSSSSTDWKKTALEFKRKKEELEISLSDVCDDLGTTEKARFEEEQENLQLRDQIRALTERNEELYNEIARLKVPRQM